MDTIGICHGATGEDNLWSHVQDKLATGLKQRRWQQARLLCAQCPLLDACERYLADYEAKGIYIDGVVAGRFSDVDHPHIKNEHRQATCLGCGEMMRPRRRADAPLVKHEHLERSHVGEGLCDKCYPIMSRKARSHGRAA